MGRASDGPNRGTPQKSCRCGNKGCPGSGLPVRGGAFGGEPGVTTSPPHLISSKGNRMWQRFCATIATAQGQPTQRDMADRPQFAESLEPEESHLKLRSACLRCGASRVVSAMDESLQNWHESHICSPVAPAQPSPERRDGLREKSGEALGASETRPVCSADQS